MSLPKLARIEQSYVLATFSALFRIYRDTPIFTAYFLVESIIRFLYELSFPMSLHVSGSNLLPMRFFVVMRLWWLRLDNSLYDVMWSVVISCLILFNILHLCIVVQFYKSRRSHQKPPSAFYKIMNIHLQWSCGPLFIPYVSIIIYAIRCNSNLQTCSIFDENVGFTILGLLAIALHSIIALFHTVSVFEPSPLSRKPHAKAHARVCIVAVVLKLITTLVVALFENQTDLKTQLAIAIVCLCYHLIVCFAFLFEMPYFSHKVNFLYVSMYAIAAMGSFSVMVRMLTADSGDAICVALFFVGSVLLLPSSYVMTQWRVYSISDRPFQKLQNSTEIDIKCRITIARIVEKQGNGNQQAEEKSWSLDDKCFQELDALFAYFEKNHKSSFKMNMIWSNYVYLFKRNRFMAMQKIQNVLMDSPFVFDLITLHNRLRYFAETTKDEEVDLSLATYQEQQKLERCATQAITKCLLYHTRFWGTLMTNDYTIPQLEYLAVRISKNTQEAQYCLQQLVIMSPKNSGFRRLYSHFLSNVMYDDIVAKRQLTLAVELEGDDDKARSLTDSSNAIIIMSAEKATMGIILEGNSKACSHLGVDIENICGKSINQFMAKPYAILHNWQLSQYILKSQKPKGIQCRQNLVWKNAGGFIFQGDIRVMEFPNYTLRPSITFFAAMKPVEQRILCVVKISDFIVWEISSLFFNHFNPDLNNVKTFQYSIKELIPNFEESIKAVQWVAGTEGETCTFEMIHKKNEQKQAMKVIVGGLPKMETEFYLITFENTNKDAEASKLFWDHPSGDVKQRVDEDMMMDRSEAKNKRIVHITSDDELSSLGLEEGSSDSNMEKGSSQEQEGEKTSVNSSKSGNLVRMSLLKTSGHFEPSLKRLFVSNIALILLIFVLGIIAQIISSTLTISKYNSNFNVLIIPFRSSTIVPSYSAIMFRHLFRNDLYLNNTAKATFEEARIRRSLVTYRNDLNLLKQIITSNDGSVDPSELAILSQTPVTMINYPGDNSSIAMVEAVQLLINAVTVLINNNLSALKADPRAIEFLELNSNQTIYAVWDTFCQAVLGTENTNNETVRLLDFYFMIAAVALVFLAKLLVFLPIMYNTLKQRMSVYYLFEEIEQGNLRDLYSQCLSKLEDFDGADNTANNMELQDLMESLATKKLSRIQSQSSQRSNAFRFTLRVLINKNSLLLDLTLLLTAVYFVGYYFWWNMLSLAQFSGLDIRVNLFHKKHFAINQILMASVDWDSQSGQSLGAMLAMNEDDIASWEESVFEIDHAIYYGDPNYNINSDLSVFSGGDTMLSGDVCQLFTAYNISVTSLTPCQGIENGVLQRGSHAALLQFLTISKTLRKFVVGSLNGTYNTSTLLSTIVELKEFGDIWLPSISTLFDAWIANVFESNYTSALTIRIVGTAVFLCAWIFLVGFVYHPMVKHMNQQLQNTRNLLTMIPSEVLDSSKKLREQMREIALKFIHES